MAAMLAVAPVCGAGAVWAACGAELYDPEGLAGSCWAIAAVLASRAVIVSAAYNFIESSCVGTADIAVCPD
jgi:hypothetical protein